MTAIRLTPASTKSLSKRRKLLLDGFLQREEVRLPRRRGMERNLLLSMANVRQLLITASLEYRKLAEM
jgi:hypothetical protein